MDGPEGCSHLVEHRRFPDAVVEEVPGSLHAPMPGRVVKVLVAESDPVVAGQALLVLEAMKMEHTFVPPCREGDLGEGATRGPSGSRPGSSCHGVSNPTRSGLPE